MDSLPSNPHPNTPPVLPSSDVPHRSWFARHIAAEIIAVLIVIALGSLAYYFYSTNRLTECGYTVGGCTPSDTNNDQQLCIQVLTTARNPQTGEVKTFPTPCDVPAGWVKVADNESTIVPSKENALLTIRSFGGLCVTGTVCESTIVFGLDRKFFLDGKLNSTVDTEDYNVLSQAINSTDFAAIKSKKFTGTCPTAYDGQEIEYSFKTSGGLEVIDSCVIDIDYNSNLFRVIQEVLDKNIQD